MIIFFRSVGAVLGGLVISTAYDVGRFKAGGTGSIRVLAELFCHHTLLDLTCAAKGVLLLKRKYN